MANLYAGENVIQLTNKNSQYYNINIDFTINVYVSGKRNTKTDNEWRLLLRHVGETTYFKDIETDTTVGNYYNVNQISPYTYTSYDRNYVICDLRVPVEIKPGKAYGSITITDKSTGKSFTCTLNRNGGSGGPNSITVTYDSSMPGGVAVPSRTGYRFDGYYDNASGGTQYYNSNMVSVRKWDKGSSTLYAHWTFIGFTISFNSNYPDSSTPASISDLATSASGQLSSLPVDPSTKWKFLGWFNEQSGGSKIVSLDESTDETPATIFESDTTVYAHWICVVNFITDNKFYHSQEVDYGTKISDPYPSEGEISDFTGWYYNKSKVTFLYTIVNNITFTSYINNGIVIIGSHSFTFNKQYLVDKFGGDINDYNIAEDKILPRNIGQNGFNSNITTDLNYTHNNISNILTIEQSFPKFARFETFDFDNYIAVAEGWGDDSNDGSDWINAVKTIDKAVESADNKTILVFDGDYDTINTDLTNVTIKLVNGTDSVSNSNLKVKDSYDGEFSINIGTYQYKDGNTYYDSLINEVENNTTYIRCTFPTLPTNYENCIFKSCVFITNNTESILGEDAYCIHGLSQELELDENNRPKYGSILCGSAEDTDYRLIDANHQPRIRSGIDIGAFEYQYKFAPNEVELTTENPDNIVISSSYPSSDFNWFDNSISGYPFLANLENSNYFSTYIYSLFNDVYCYDLFEVKTPTNVSLVIKKIYNFIFVDNFNYSNNEQSDERYPYYSLINPKKYGITQDTKGVVVTNLNSALNLYSDGKIILCRGIYKQNENNELLINKVVEIESDAGADETILLGDGNNNTNRYITITDNGKLTLTGVTIKNSISKTPTSNSDYNKFGGAIAVVGNINCSARIIACRFNKCKSTICGSVYGRPDGSSIELYNCVINNSFIDKVDIGSDSKDSIDTDNIVKGNTTKVLYFSSSNNKIYNTSYKISVTLGGSVDVGTDNNWEIKYKLDNGLEEKLLHTNASEGQNYQDHIVWDITTTEQGETYGLLSIGDTGATSITLIISCPVVHDQNSINFTRLSGSGKISIPSNYSIGNALLYNCDIAGELTEPTSEDKYIVDENHHHDCINLSSTVIPNMISKSIGNFYRIPYNITNSKINDLINKSENTENIYLDFNLCSRGYEK